MDLRREKVERTGGTLVVQVASALRSAILSGQFKPGEKLPSEARLTEAHDGAAHLVRFGQPRLAGQLFSGLELT